MSSLALMRLLEGAPRRYDAGMRLLTLGSASRIHEALAVAAAPAPSARVLEIGCGTGAVTARLADRRAIVTAIDQNPEMLEQARTRLAGARGNAVTWIERTACEIDALPKGAFDAVVAGFALSEMSANERRFVLGEAFRRLRPGGMIAAGDEVSPRTPWIRWIFRLLRAPQAALGWLLIGSVSRPIPDLASEIRAAGFDVRGEERWLFQTLAVVIGERPR